MQISGGLRGFAAMLVSLVAMTGTSAFAGFYDATPQELAGEPGTLIRYEPMSGGGVGKAFRVLYRSTGLSGEPIAVSGIVVVPHGKAPEGGRNIVAWAHPTTGVARHCAPSLGERPLLSIPGLTALAERNYVVTATDYPGLGTAGPHPYLIGVSEGRAVLDSVRAARQIAEAGANERFVVWGHSQGGHAALHAGQLAKSYAPELTLIGVAAAAPAVELAALVKDDLGTTSGNILTAMALWSWWKLYDAPFDKMVKADIRPTVEKVASLCMENEVEGLAVVDAARPLKQGFLTSAPDKTKPWSTIIADNAPATKSDAPLFIARGSSDEVIPSDVSLDYVTRLCANNVAVRVLTLDNVQHALMAKDSAAIAVGWIYDRFAGVPAPTSCPR